MNFFAAVGFCAIALTSALGFCVIGLFAYNGLVRMTNRLEAGKAHEGRDMSIMRSVK